VNGSTHTIHCDARTAHKKISVFFRGEREFNRQRSFFSLLRDCGVTVSNRIPVLSKATMVAQPDGRVKKARVVGFGARTQRSEELCAQPSPSIDTGTPPWQRDIGYSGLAKVTPHRERQNLIKSLTALGQAGVIIDDTQSVLEGTSGWVANLQGLATIKLASGLMRPVSAISQDDFLQAIMQIKNNQSVAQASVVLRDLDGWGRDIVQLLPVGEANPDCVLVLMPKSNHAIAKIFEDLARGLGLSRSEIAIGKLILVGQVDCEIAASMSLEITTTRLAAKAVLRKFKVRRNSDLIALFARLP
jgi:hypothetical protein